MRIESEIHAAAWRRCVEIDAAGAARANDAHDWWTGERERRMVAEAEEECRRLRELRHAAELARHAPNVGAMEVE